MHMDAQEKSFYVRIYRQKWRAPRSRRTVCASLRSQNAHGHVTRIILREFTGKRPHPKIAMHSLCEPAQSKRTSTCHKSHFVREFQRKFPPPKVAMHKIVRACCLRCRNTRGHVTGAILCENLQEKCRAPRSRRTVCASVLNRTADGHL